MNTTFYLLEAQSPAGTIIPFSASRGKVVLIVNTATKCGLTPQFGGLQDLHQKYSDRGLVIIGFPCDQFAGQEPESNQRMEQVCHDNHGVTFQLTEKCNVNGPHTHPVFRYLKKALGGFLGSRVKWNFTKFLIDRNGKPYKRYAPITKPRALEKDIRKLLGEQSATSH